MTAPRTYQASCHCGAIRFTFTCEEITSGRRCNCSICIRKGVVMSSSYFHPSDVAVEGEEGLALYRFGDRDMNHFFCRTCGIAPFSTVASVPPGYRGPARPGDYRINLGCVHDLDVLSLDIQVIDGKAL
ncbi:MAG TPA: hypothetical protein VFP65_22910 [Anaeromyxobacteraceae bacterium]|nr:hypothetical protein [Anaeromyxobacteraceae bacterium]